MRLRSRLSVGLAVSAAGLATIAIVLPGVDANGAAAAVAAPRPPSARLSPIPLTRRPAPTFMSTIKRSATPVSVPTAALAPRASRSARSRRPRASSSRARRSWSSRGNYTGTTISVSGTAQAPITFDAIGLVIVERRLERAGVTISGAHNVVLDGFSAVASSEPSTSPAARPTSPSTADMPPTKAPDRGQSKWAAQPATSRSAGCPSRGGTRSRWIRARPAWSSPATPSRLT